MMASKSLSAVSPLLWTPGSVSNWDTTVFFRDLTFSTSKHEPMAPSLKCFFFLHTLFMKGIAVSASPSFPFHSAWMESVAKSHLLLFGTAASFPSLPSVLPLPLAWVIFSAWWRWPHLLNSSAQWPLWMIVLCPWPTVTPRTFPEEAVQSFAVWPQGTPVTLFPRVPSVTLDYCPFRTSGAVPLSAAPSVRNALSAPLPGGLLILSTWSSGSLMWTGFLLLLKAS